MPTYPRAPVEFVRGEGSTLWDADGAGVRRPVLRALGPQRRATAIRGSSPRSAEQAATLAGTSNLFYSEPAMRLSERLVELSLGGRAFLCNSGAEANECAIKLVRRHAHARGIERPEIVVLDHAFHGRTLGALSATPRLARRGPVRAAAGGVRRGPARRRRGAASGGRRAHGGGDDRADPGRVRGPPDRRRRSWPPPARHATRPGPCSSSTRSRPAWGGPARSGPIEGLGIRPDVMTSAKALGGGLPVGACLIAPGGGGGADPRRARLDLRRRADLRPRRARGPRDPLRSRAAAKPCGSASGELRAALSRPRGRGGDPRAAA